MAQSPSPVPPRATRRIARGAARRLRAGWGLLSRTRLLLRLLPLAVALGVLSWLLGAWTTDDANFSVTARTEVLTLQTGCAQPLVWDLPAGQLSTPERLDAGQAPTAGEALALGLRGGAQVRLRLDAEGHWLIDAVPSPVFGCTDDQGRTAPDTVTAQVDGVALPPAPQGFVYRSDRPAQDAPRPLWLLRGRVLLGEEIAFGSGLASAAATPLLASANIEARTPDALTAQRRLIHDERVDAGGQIDTHACLSARQEALPACVRRRAWSAEGFVHLGDAQAMPGFDVQLSVTGERIGVRQHGGGERQIVVTWWQRLRTDSGLQIFAALLLTVSTLVQILPLLERAGDARD
jgi:hypothetical protein